MECQRVPDFRDLYLSPGRCSPIDLVVRDRRAAIGSRRRPRNVNGRIPARRARVLRRTRGRRRGRRRGGDDGKVPRLPLREQAAEHEAGPSDLAAAPYHARVVWIGSRAGIVAPSAGGGWARRTTAVVLV